MEYVDADDRRTERVIKPLHVRKRNRELVLVAHCQLRNERRSFKLDRVVSLSRFEPEAEPGLFGDLRLLVDGALPVDASPQ